MTPASSRRRRNVDDPPVSYRCTWRPARYRTYVKPGVCVEHMECRATVGTRRNLHTGEHGLGVLLYEWVWRLQEDERQFSGQQSLI